MIQCSFWLCRRSSENKKSLIHNRMGGICRPRRPQIESVTKSVTDRRTDGPSDGRTYVHIVALSQLKNTAENRKRTIYQRRMINDATSMIFTIFWSIFPSARPSIQSPPDHFNSFRQFGTIYGMNTVLSPLNMRSHQLKKLDEVHNFIVFVCIQLNTMNIIDVVSVRL